MPNKANLGEHVEGNRTENGGEAFLRVASILLCFMLATPVGSPTAENNQTIGKILAGGNAEINGVPVSGESTLFAGDWVTTKDGWVRLLLAEGEQVQFAEHTRGSVSREADYALIYLQEGRVAVAFQTSRPLRVETDCILVMPYTYQDPVWQVTQRGRWRTRVSVDKGGDLGIRVVQMIDPGTPPGTGGRPAVLLLRDGQRADFNCSPAVRSAPVVAGVTAAVAAIAIPIAVTRGGGESPSVP